MLLRDVTEEDLPTLFEHQCEPRANRMAKMPARDRDAFMLHWRTKVLGEPNAMKKAIVVAGEVVGNIVTWQGKGMRLVGYWIGSTHWGKGIASTALAQLLRDHEQTRPLHAFVSVANVASLRVLTKCGFAPVEAAVLGVDGVEELLLRLD